VLRVQATDVLETTAETVWTDVESGQFGATPYEFVDEDAAQMQRRFYRVISP